MRIQTVFHGLKEAPFDINLENVKSLPSEVGLKLYKEIDAYNKLDEVKKKDSKTPTKN